MILLLLFVLIISTLIFVYKFEHMIIYDVSLNSEIININSKEFDLSERTIQKLKKIPFIKVNEYSNINMNITDSYTAWKKKEKVFKVCEDQKSLLFIKKRDHNAYEHITEMKSKTVGYPTDIHRDLFEIICKVHGITVPKLIKTNKLEDVDMLIFFESIFNKKNISEDIDFIAYDKYDIHKLKYFLPFCKIYTTPLNLQFPTYRDKYPVKTYIGFDMVLTGPPKLTDFPKYNPPTEPELNFLKMFLESYEVEPFAIEINPNQNVDGKLLNNKFYLKQPYIEGIPITPGTHVIMKNQNIDYENGKYIASESKILENQKKSEPNYKYECIDNIKITQQKDCPGVWDAPCKLHENCPFFGIKNNYFGGCVDGYCQMPIGVERVGYRKYKGEPYLPIAFPLDIFEK